MPEYYKDKNRSRSPYFTVYYLFLTKESNMAEMSKMIVCSFIFPRIME